MDDTSTRAINFAVALIVTLVVVTLVVASFSKIKEVYKLTKNTDISLHGRFENIYQTYDGKELNGMGLLNTIKKFEDATDLVESITYPSSSTVKATAQAQGKRESTLLKEYLKQNKKVGTHTFTFSNKYKVEVKEVSGKTVINFK